MGKNRYCVIMAGGVGSRFWPFSRAGRPKQFLDLFGMGRSLLRMAYDRFATVVPRENIFISTHEQYVDLVMEQLPVNVFWPRCSDAIRLRVWHGRLTISGPSIPMPR